MPTKKAARSAKGVTLDGFDEALSRNLALAESDPESLGGLGKKEGNPHGIAPAVPEAEDWAEKAVRKAAASGEDWKKGVLMPRRDPIEAAKASNERYKLKMREALDQDSYAKGLDAVDKNLMYAVIEATDPSAFTGGIRRREAKIKAAVEKLRPKVLALKQTIAAMPNTTDDEREQRMLAARRGMIRIKSELKAAR